MSTVFYFINKLSDLKYNFKQYKVDVYLMLNLTKINEVVNLLHFTINNVFKNCLFLCVQ